MKPANQCQLVVLAGIFIRLVQYLYNRSLRLDELLLLRNLKTWQWSGFFDQLGDHQFAPPGFLALEKWTMDLMGDSEYALRLFPLIFSIFSLILFSKLCSKMLTEPHRIFALLFFSLTGPLIFFSSDFKPYSSDVFFALLLICQARHLMTEDDSFRKWSIFLVSSGCAMMLSYSSFLVLATILIYFVGCHFEKKKSFWSLTLFTLFFFSLSLFFYHFYFQEHLEDAAAKLFWDRGFWPMTEHPLEQLAWLRQRALSFFDVPGGFYLSVLALLLFLMGAWGSWEKDKADTFLLIGPILCTLLASAFQIYPFHNRLLLFLVPLSFILIVQSFEKLPYIVSLLLSVILLTYPVVKTGKYLFEVKTPDHVKPILGDLKKNITTEDRLYLYFGTDIYWQYYAPRFQLDKYQKQIFLGPEDATDWPAHQRALEAQFEYKRLWVLLRHRGINKKYVEFLSQKYHKEKAFESTGWELYLFTCQK